MRARLGRGEQYLHLRVFNDQRKAILGIRGIERNICAAGLEDSEQADDQSFRASHGDADQRIGLHAEGLQMARQAIGALRRARDK